MMHRSLYGGDGDWLMIVQPHKPHNLLFPNPRFPSLRTVPGSGARRLGKEPFRGTFSLEQGHAFRGSTIGAACRLGTDCSSNEHTWWSALYITDVQSVHMRRLPESFSISSCIHTSLSRNGDTRKGRRADCTESTGRKPV